MRIAVAGGTGTVGHHVVEVARGRGHDVVVLSRSTGVDLTTGAGVADALAGAAAVVDVTSVATQSAEASRRFFGGVTRTLLAAEEAVGVGHHILLGIVGSTAAPHGYYAGKALQERVVEQGQVPYTIVRATQFHEFARQVFGSYRVGPIALVPRMRSQPIAARAVAEHLVTLAEGVPLGRVPELAGPREESMARLVRAYARAIGSRAAVVEMPLPGGFGAALRDGTILPATGARLDAETFDEWLARDAS